LFGTVTSVGLISSSSGSTASYPVVVTVTGAQTGLHDGTSVTTEIIYKQLTNVLTVPSAAIKTENGSSYVTVVATDGTQTKTAVKTGLTSGTATQITSGLSEGDEVLVTTYTGTGTGTGSGTGGYGNRGYNTNRTGTGGYGNFPAGGGNFPAGGGNFPAGGGNFPAGGGNFPGGATGGN
jgi:hypothetical protein